MHGALLSISYLFNSTENVFVIGGVVIGVSALVGYFDRRYGLALFFTLLTTYLITDVLKLIFHVPRPDTALVTLNSYRFPSMHAALAGAIAGSLWWHVIRRVTSPLSRAEVTTAAITIIVFVSYTRIILGVHKPIDLVVGGFIGVLVALPIHFYFSRVRR